jgi:hypothetical protein
VIALTSRRHHAQEGGWHFRCGLSKAAAVRVALASAAFLLAMSLETRTAEAKTVEEVAAELANPLAPITTLAANVRTEMGNGPQDETNYQLRLQPSFFKPFADNSALLVRTIVPLRLNSWPTCDRGLGDLSIVPYYVPDTTSTTFVGYGGALILPTATEDALGTGKWAAGPAVIVAKTGKPITWGGLIQHVWSFAGAADRADVSVTTVQPFVTRLLPDGWAATISSETTYNWKASAGNEWTVPLTVGAAKVVKFGGEFANLGLAYVNYLEHPDYTTKSEVRLSATYVWR